MLITRSDDGYFGMRQCLAGVFDKAVSSWFVNVSEEHGLTEDGRAVAPIFAAFRSKLTALTSNAVDFSSRKHGATENRATA